MKHGAGGQRSLVTAGLALIQMTGAVKIGFTMTATQALEALGPPHPKQLLLTSFFGTKLFLKLQQTEGLLFHDITQISFLF